MTNSMRAEAESSRDDKMRRMGLKITTADLGNDEGDGHVMPAVDGSQGVVSPEYASGFKDKSGMAKARVEKMLPPINGNKTKPRLDRPAYAAGGKVGKAKGATTVNVVIAPQGPSSSPGGLPVPPSAMVPPPALPQGVPAAGLSAGPPLPGGLPLRKRGGRVAQPVPDMEAGAGGGIGRLQKAREYGRNAKP